MEIFMDTRPFKRITDLITFQQEFKTKPQKTYQIFCGKPENVNQTFRDENYELTSANETQNTTIQTSTKNLIKNDQLKKRFLIPFIVSHQ